MEPILREPSVVGIQGNNSTDNEAAAALYIGQLLVEEPGKVVILDLLGTFDTGSLAYQLSEQHDKMPNPWQPIQKSLSQISYFRCSDINDAHERLSSLADAGNEVRVATVVFNQLNRTLLEQKISGGKKPKRMKWLEQHQTYAKLLIEIRRVTEEQGIRTLLLDDNYVAILQNFLDHLVISSGSKNTLEF